MHPRVLLLLLAGLAVASLGLSVLAGPRIAGGAMAGAAMLRAAGLAGLAGFAAAFFIVALVGIVPGALLGLAAGAIFGLEAGFAAGAIGSLAGAAAAFGLSRSFLRPHIAAFLARHGRLARLDTQLGADGWRLVALVRVSPVMPFSLTSYALGLSRIKFSAYLLGSLASLPNLLGYAALGALGGDGLGALRGDGARLPGTAGPGTAGHDIRLALLALGAAATLALIWHMTRLLGRALEPS